MTLSLITDKVRRRPTATLIPRFTNVSVIRLRRGGKRFEVRRGAQIILIIGRVLQEQSSRVALRRVRATACSCAHCSEKDLDEVVQVENVFTNVSKGQAASKEDLSKAFGTTDVSEVLHEVGGPAGTR